MIVQIVLNFIGTLISTIIGWIPTLPEQWVSGIATGLAWLANLAGLIAPLGVIMNWSQFAIAAGIYITALAAVVAISIIKYILSLVTGGGGAN